ncbi:U-scoloptoxin(01)-Er1a-like [Eriocheir sinensis]|uniref:U-scoloptoxin(01)-Er1a-like n=1 Tax=Eriocheir sinensis TaxID=95602 RepID=UPI0021C835A8|nr:U-scoloptoxin(01)-Er1a-like [Eriocheir sinensis]
MKVLAALLCLAAAASARMAYRFSDGYLDILGAEPVQNFECLGRSYGYYADVATDCRVFHVCLPITDDAGEVAETAHFSFVCGNQTVFSQESLTCATPAEAIPCTDSESLYEISNSEFGIVDDLERK